MTSKFNDVKSVTAMYHFNKLGCVIGKDALEKKQKIFQIQQAKLIAARKKEEEDYRQKKANYDEFIALKLTDEKLTAAQLKTLLSLGK